MIPRITLAALLVPVLGLAVLVARAEYTVRSGTVWTIPIAGYDPRDLLHGQYLEYRYQWNWHGADTCGVPLPTLREPSPGCCLCLTRTADDGFDPSVRQIHCDETETCEATLQSEFVLPPQRYFVPEDRGHELEQALFEHAAAIELTASPGGKPAVRELVLDRKPWRDVLAR